MDREECKDCPLAKRFSYFITLSDLNDGITKEDASRIGLTATPDFEEALTRAFIRHGKQASIGVGAHIACVVIDAEEVGRYCRHLHRVQVQVADVVAQPCHHIFGIMSLVNGIEERTAVCLRVSG